MSVYYNYNYMFAGEKKKKSKGYETNKQVYFSLFTTLLIRYLK